MNRRIIVIAIAAGALALFALAAYFYRGANGEAPVDLTPARAPIAASPDSVAPIENVAGADAASTEQEPDSVSAPAPAPQWNAYVRRHSPVIGPANAPVTIVDKAATVTAMPIRLIVAAPQTSA